MSIVAISKFTLIVILSLQIYSKMYTNSNIFVNLSRK